jgi:hypothetical protein
MTTSGSLGDMLLWTLALALAKKLIERCWRHMIGTSSTVTYAEHNFAW